MSEPNRPLIPMITSTPHLPVRVNNPRQCLISPFRSLKVKSSGRPSERLTLPPLDNHNKSVDSPPKKRRNLHSRSFGVLNLKAFTSYAFQTMKGTEAGRPKAQNQDHCFVSEKQCLFGICDGHGKNGHLVSSYISSQLPYLFDKYDWTRIAQILEEKVNDNFDTKYSGSTLNAVSIANSHVVCCNIGDTRAVIGKFKSQRWMAYSLSKDHKPSEASEKKRIEDNGGKVEASWYGGPQRVWLRNIAKPGLAMSRSIGDAVATSVGVFALPDVRTVALSCEDKFCIVASDGVWEVMSSQEAVELAVEGWTQALPQMCCSRIVGEAFKRWSYSKGSDDITVLVVFLQSN